MNETAWMTFGVVFGMVTGLAIATPNGYYNRNATAHYYCGQNGGPVQINERGDSFMCRDGSAYEVHLVKVREAYDHE